MRFPAIVTTLNNPADIPIRVACHGVYARVEFEDTVASVEQLLLSSSEEH